MFTIWVEAVLKFSFKDIWVRFYFNGHFWHNNVLAFIQIRNSCMQKYKKGRGSLWAFLFWLSIVINCNFKMILPDAERNESGVSVCVCVCMGPEICTFCEYLWSWEHPVGEVASFWILWSKSQTRLAAVLMCSQWDARVRGCFPYSPIKSSPRVRMLIQNSLAAEQSLDSHVAACTCSFFQRRCHILEKCEESL